ncbi:hypothetical protein EVAR_3734_1 [Eumeta japonica]|uniref:Uncharacterized protein n=1 Tax=Eumeta variegata TaxID=151549 RepID=A0A4C1SSC5_EUMVA|nr:hypothetical protein EVAR_3734_1 [Eumeta japonica]
MKNKELKVELFMDIANIDILCITKHWLKNGQLLFGFPNHQVASSFSRENSLLGGSLIVICNNLKFKERTDIVGLSAERVVKIACVELERLIVMSVYKPPHSSYELFESIMDRAVCKRLRFGVNREKLLEIEINPRNTAEMVGEKSIWPTPFMKQVTLVGALLAARFPTNLKLQYASERCAKSTYSTLIARTSD